MGRKHKKRFKGSKQDNPAQSEVPVVQAERIAQAGSHRAWNITTFKALLMIAVVGLAVFLSGLNNPFMHDDRGQIVDNPVVHSIGNVRLFFQGSTFYNGQGVVPLTGTYYRPLMTTAFSLVYTVFGEHPVAFHLLQLLLHVLGAFVLFLVLRYFFRPPPALALSLIFLVHPINSQAVFSIPAMQEPLHFFFGILAIWTLIRFQDASRWYLLLTAGCLFLSLLSKESGVVFIVVALLYAFITSRRRFYALLGLSGFCFGVYLLLKIPAVGVFKPYGAAPIDQLDLWGRMLNVPPMLLFYLAKFLFPWQLAHAYHWVHHEASLTGFALPLLIDLAAIGLAIRVGLKLHEHGRKRELLLYLFFAAWLVLGLGIYMQILPLDATVTETWFYVPMAGLLGMIAVCWGAFQPRVSNRLTMLVLALVIAGLGARTAMRGFDWRDEATLARRDLTVSREDFTSAYNLAADYVAKGDYQRGGAYAKQSLAMFPTAQAYHYLGVSYVLRADYPRARHAFKESLNLSKSYTTVAVLALAYAGDGSANTAEARDFISNALDTFPEDATLWTSLAEVEFRSNDKEAARQAILEARRHGQVDDGVYQIIMEGQ